MGKPPPPQKHQCDPALPCTILLSEVGRHFHSFPKGALITRFVPPAVPVSVQRYLKSHPPTWSWTIKAGPNAGKSFSVPTVPTTCSKDSPGAVQWLVSTFHAFKAILTPMAFDKKTRQVLPAYVKLFQNNMLIHLVQQSRSQMGPPPPTKSKAPPGPPLPPSAPRVEIATLRSELAALQAEFEEFKSLYESSSSKGSSPPSIASAPHAASTVVPAHPPSPSTVSTMSIVQERTTQPQHTWIQPILDHLHCPAFLHHVDSSMVPSHSHAMPDNVYQTIVVMYPKGSPRQLGFDSNGDLCVAGSSPASSMVVCISADKTFPPPHHQSHHCLADDGCPNHLLPPSFLYFYRLSLLTCSSPCLSLQAYQYSCFSRMQSMFFQMFVC